MSSRIANCKTLRNICFLCTYWNTQSLWPFFSRWWKKHFTSVLYIYLLISYNSFKTTIFVCQVIFLNISHDFIFYYKLLFILFTSEKFLLFSSTAWWENYLILIKCVLKHFGIIIIIIYNIKIRISQSL